MGFVSNNKTPSTVRGTQSDTNTYDVSKLQYPIDLDSSPEYGGHKVVFFINVPATGAIAKGEAFTKAMSTGDNPADIQYGMGSVDIPPNQYMKKSGDEVKDVVGGLVAGLGIKADVLQKYKRLTAAISLYVPNSLQTGWSVSWGEEDMSDGALLDSIAGAMTKIGGDGILKTTESVGSAVSNVAGTLAAKSVASQFNSGKFKYAQKAAGVTHGNSKVEQLFKSVDFRTFQFNFDFAPKSEDEANNVFRIIRMFRYHMLPEYFDSQNFLYIYPSEFDVKYYREDKENEYLEKQMTAVLTNISVNYTPNGQYTTFANGMPTHISVNMAFKELSVPTKETSPFWKSGI